MDLNTQLLDAYGRPIFSFGGENAYSTDIYKGYFVSLEWFVDVRSTEPVMMIRDAKGGHHSGAIGICLSSIGKYADPDTHSNATPGAIGLCRGLLPALGKNLIDLEARTLLDVILHFAPKLILMPPTPRDVVREAMPDAIIDVELIHGETGKTHSQVSI